MGIYDGAISANRFSITIDGYEIASFGQLSMVGTVEVMYDAAGKPVAPGSRARAVLQRGLTSSTELWGWHQAAASGSAAGRRSATLVGYTPDGKAVVRYYLEKAWPVKIEVGPVPGTTTQQLCETLTLNCEVLSRISP
ncbi:phage tail protein [Streptomyces sp. NPDC050738]|uniref:phage tail protein n=1 Tax=Streptomyces sp. NPDC050738 TaxID=3154744 RepID=UPI003436FB70